MKITFLFIFALFCRSVQAQIITPDTSAVLINHPRLLLFKGEEQKIKLTIASSRGIANINRQIIEECNRLLDVVPVQKILIGRRLLDKSREALRRIYYLSYAWRMTRQDKYFKRAELELLAISKFSDWNPSLFLDVAEMTMAASIGYDWLYEGLSRSSRTIIKDAIVKKGLEPSMNPQYNGWLKTSNNWNQVCNAGMTFGAIAVYEDYTELSKTLINRAITAIRLPMKDYAPHGAYPEGYGYWGYGTNFNVLFLAAVEKLFHQDFDLSGLSGFLQTAGFMENMTGPSGYAFNFSDSGLKSTQQPDPAMFWFAGRLKDPGLLWVEQTRMLNANSKENIKNRLLPGVMIWSVGINTSEINAPKALMWAGSGKTPVALMRSSWTDPNAIYLAIKGGSVSTNHAHMDIGSFIMEAEGVRWAMDFGAEDYTKIEANGVSLFNMKANSPRWAIFRYKNQAHNTLTFNDSAQDATGKAGMISSSKKSDNMNAVIDLTSIYKTHAKNVKRGAALIDKQYVLIRDEIASNEEEAIVRWNMLTSANVKLLSNTKAELIKGGKKLYLQVQEPANIVLKTWETAPLKSYESPNPGTVFIGFEVRIPASSNSAVSVLLIPGKSINNKVLKEIAPLKQWPVQ